MKECEKQKNTIIYGGAFNPPTRAHQMILQACIDYAEAHDADVWLLPSGSRSDKTIDQSRDARLKMMQALTCDVVMRTVQVSIETSELYRLEPTETYDTVMRFDERYPEHRFMWVFGSDSLKTMPEWHQGAWLVENLPLLVVERPGTPVEYLGRNATKLYVDTIDVSSTQVRSRIAARESIEHLVSPSVLACLQS